MSTSYQIIDQRAPYFLTFQIVDWVDIFIHLIARSDVHLSDNIRDIKKFTSYKIIEAIEASPESRKEWILKIFKAKALMKKANKEYQVWTHENHAILLSTNEFIKSKVDYIHSNPVRAGIVEKPEDYLYSSARNYASLGAPIDIPTLFLPWKTYS